MLLSNDCVIVPDFGGFMAHHVEARKDGADGMLLPPARTIGFNPKLTINDSLLAQSYVECYDISYPEALVRIGDEVRELRQHLENDGSYELHGIGVIFLNGEGHYVFEPCEAGILTPALYGLSDFEMQSLCELDEKQVEASTNKQQGSKLMDIGQMSSETMSGEQVSDAKKELGRNVVIFWRTIAAACVAALVFLLYPSSLENNHQLVTASAVNVELLQRVLPKAEVTADGTVASEPKVLQPSGNANYQARKVATTQSSLEGYVIVLASRVSPNNARTYVEMLNRQGYTEAKVVSGAHDTKVVYGFYVEREEACHVLKSLRKNTEFAEAWIMKHHQ